MLYKLHQLNISGLKQKICILVFIDELLNVIGTQSFELVDIIFGKVWNSLRTKHVFAKESLLSFQEKIPHTIFVLFQKTICFINFDVLFSFYWFF